MNNRKLFQEIMNYGQFDRMPVIHWRGWNETHERWYEEGCNAHDYFDAVPQWTYVGGDG